MSEDNKYITMYNDKILPLKKDFNKKRISGMIICLFVILGEITLTVLYRLDLFFIIITISIMLFSKSMFITKIKNQIFPDVIKAINPDLEYAFQNGIKKEDFINSEIYNYSFNRFIVADSICGQINNKHIQMADLLVEQHTGSGRNSHTTTIFKGTFFVIKVTNNFKSKIKITHNLFNDNGLLKTLFEDKNKVNLENPEFEKIFDVFADDQIYAREILTFTFMEKLVLAYNVVGKRMLISFKEDTIYISLEKEEMISDEQLLFKGLDIKNIEKMIDNIDKLIELTNYLNF